jgi:hypothetical protein
MAERYPLTLEQLRQANDDISSMLAQAEQLAQLMCACYGDSDMRTIRAQETHAALQRLRAEIARHHAHYA